MNRRFNIRHRNRLNSNFCSILFATFSLLGVISPLETANGKPGNGGIHIRGGTLIASSLTINSDSMLTIDTGYGSKVILGDGTGTITNNGTIRVLANPLPDAGNQYSPISAGTWSGNGTYEAVGGTWDATSHVFTASQTLDGFAGAPVTIDLAQQQRVLVEESAKGWTVGASFMAKSGTGNSFDFTATAIADSDLTALSGLVAPGQSVLSGWNFTAVGSGYNAADPIYLSFGVPASLAYNDVQVWDLRGGNWSLNTINDLSAQDGLASFTVAGLSGYAVTASLPSVSWKADADGTWQNGSNWTASPIAPGGVNVAAVLGPTITAPRTVALGGPLTLGALTFDSAQHYTLADVESLNLEVNPGYTAKINVLESDSFGHVIETPITISSPLEISIAPSAFLTLTGEVQNPTGKTLTLSGRGTLTVTQGIATTGAVNVQAGTLITSSLTANSLTIGGGSTLNHSVVPEPSSTILLFTAIAGIVGRLLLVARKEH